MNKPAPVAHPILELLVTRWSPLAFDSRAVPETALASLFEAARWAPSSYNEQPWAYIVGLTPSSSEHQRVLACLVEANQAWAKAAPVLMIGLAKKTFDKNGAINGHARHDLGAASAFLTLQAESMGLRVHQMAGIDPERARREFKVPENWDPVTGIAIGYPGRPESLPEPLRAREQSPRSRKPASAFVFTGSWGSPAPGVS